MTSNINYSAINENFPVAGQDNDTQVFRDNFDTIKTNFQTAQTEITALQAATQGLALTAYDETDVHGSDYNGGIIFNAILQNSFERKFDGGSTNVTVTIDYENGNYQVFRIGANVNIEFLNFPSDTDIADQIGKVTLELYSDSSTTRTVTFSTTGGTVIKKNSNPAWSGNSIELSSAEAAGGSGNPVIIEVWQHKTDRIFLNYLGQFSS